MFALNSLKKLVWGSKETPESFRISSGVLYELRPGAKIQRKCLYKDAELSIRRTDIKHQFQLVVQQVLYEGEDELGSSDDVDDDDELAFLIDAKIRFTATILEGHQGFKWLDPLDPQGLVSYEYIVEDAKIAASPMRDKFAAALASCIWERENHRSCEEATEAEIKRIITRAEDEELEGILNNVSITDEEVLAAATADEGVANKGAERSVSVAVSPNISVPSPRAPENVLDQLPAEPTELARGDIEVSVLGSLYIFEPSSGTFIRVSEEVALTVVCVGKFDYCINIISNDHNYVSQKVEPAMNAMFNHTHRSLIWNYFVDGQAYSFSLKAADDAHYDILHQGMTKAAYEMLNREPWSKVSASSQDYMLDAYEQDAELASIPENWSDSPSANEHEDYESDREVGVQTDQSFRNVPVPEARKVAKPARRVAARTEPVVIDSDKEESESESESESDSGDDYTGSEDSEADDDDEDAEDGQGRPSEKNSRLAVGYKHGRSFVVRGNRIGVFKHTDKGGIRFDTTINGIDDTHGKTFTPSGAMLHEQDASMVLMNQDNPNSLYKMDLEYGKVVEEWKVDDIIPTVAIAPSSKYSQMTAEKTLVGLSDNMLYRIDPRLRGDSLVVQSELKSYATKSQFTAAATTEKGQVVVGSAKGEIRLFSRLGIRAMTSLPALGEPILGIDVTSDGRYIVATCKAYLLLIDAKLPHGENGSTGFNSSFPRDAKPAPKRLQLKPEHVVYMGREICFTPAKFNQSPEGKQSESTIVTSTGPFVVTWNLKRVLGGGRGEAYSIKQYPELVVADNFQFGQDRSIVVTLPNDVQTVTKSQLARPSRKSIMPTSNDVPSSDR
ncbi:Vacuolar import and degradation protein 27 [Coemansia sp. Benny D115]|nr:Vacuolar import and degradation protein 27 [Coemansia sp. Benny D115]